MLAVNLAIKAGMWVWDKLNVTLEEQQEIVDNLSSEISSLEEEEKKLLALRDEGGLTEAEQSRLDYLQQRLELDQKIYEQEQKKLAENELYGRGGLLNEGVISSKSGSSKVGKSAQKYGNTMFHIERVEKQLDTYTKAAQEMADAGNTFAANLYKNDIDKSKQKLQDYNSTLLETEKEYLEYADTIKKYLDAGVYDDDQEEKTKMEQLYQDYLDMANKIENDVVTVNIKIGEIDTNDYKNRIKQFFSDKKGSVTYTSQYEAYFNSLSEDELRTVSMGIDNDTIKSYQDAKNAVDEYRKSLEKAKEAGEDVANVLGGTLESVKTAFESANSSVDWTSLSDYLEKAKKLFDGGFIGTDDFQSVAQWMNPQKIDTSAYTIPANAYADAWKKNYEKVSRWFNSEDQTASMWNFWNDLKKVDPTLVDIDKSTGNIKTHFKSTQEVADKLGTSVEVVSAVLKSMSDYGFVFDDVEDTYQTIEKIKDEISSLRDVYDDLQDGTRKEKLGKLIENWDKQVAGFNDDMSALTEGFDIPIKFEYNLQQLYDQIDKIKTKMKFGNENKEDYSSLLSYNDQAIKMLEDQTNIDTIANDYVSALQSGIDEATDEMQSRVTSGTASDDEIMQMQKKIEAKQTEYLELLDEFNNWLDGKNIDISSASDDDFVEYWNEFFSTPHTLTIDTKINNADSLQSLMNKISIMAAGTVITFTANVDGVEQTIEAVKQQDGSVVFTANVDGVETQLDYVKTDQNGVITFTADPKQAENILTKFESKVNNSNPTVKVGANTSSAVTATNNTIDSISNSSAVISVGGNFDSLKSTWNNIASKINATGGHLPLFSLGGNSKVRYAGTKYEGMSSSEIARSMGSSLKSKVNISTSNKTTKKTSGSTTATTGVGNINGNLISNTSKDSGNSSGSGGGGGGGGSETEAYQAEIDALRNFTEAYEDAKAKREAIDKKYDNAKTNEEKIALMKDRITAMEEEQKAIEALNEARDKEIQKNVAELKAKNFDVSYDPYTDKLHISNLEHLNELKGKDQEDTNELIHYYEDLINKTEEMADANKDLAVTWQDNNYTLEQYNDDLQSLKEQIYDDKITDIEFKISVAKELNNTEDQIKLFGEEITTTLKELNDAYAQGLDNTSEKVQKLIKQLMDASNGIKEARKQLLEDKRDKYDSAKNAVIKVIENNIEALEKQKEELQAINDEQDRALKLAQLKEALSKAKQNKVVHIYRKGIGWTYEADEDDIKQKEQDLADFENEQRINDIEKQIDALNDYKDMWDKITDKWQEAADKLKASNIFGSDWEERVNDCTLDVEDFGDKYYNVCEDIEKITKQTAQDILNEYEDLFGRIANLIRVNHPETTTKDVTYYYANKDGTAPAGAKVGDRILTGGGVYEIVDPSRKDEAGVYQSTITGLYSKKVEDLITKIDDNNAGQYAYTGTIEVLNDNVLVTKKSIDQSNTNTSKNTTGLNTNTSAVSTNSSYVDDATDSVDNLNITMQGLPDDIKDAVSSGVAESIAKGTQNGGNINADGTRLPGVSYDGNDNPILIDEDTFKKGLEQLKETVGEDSDAYKSARDYYLSFFGEKGEKVSGVNANKNAGYNSGKKYDNFEDFFKSYNTSYIGNGFYQFNDIHGHTTAANKDWFKNSYITGSPSGYTDRQHAQSTLNKMIELGVLDEWLNDPNSREYTKHLLDLVNTGSNGDKKATIKAREDAERVYREILNAKNGNSESSVGSYDASGKKVTSLSYDRDHNLVKTGYSDTALDFSDIVDNITEIPNAEDIYNSDVFNKIYDKIVNDPNYEPGSNVDANRAYRSDYNKQYNDLKISADRQDKNIKSNSDKLKENSDAMGILNDTFGEGAYDLKEGLNGVVEVVDKATNTLVGTINTKNGEIYRGGSSGGGSNGGGNKRGDFSSDGTYRDSYSQSDKDAIKKAQDAYKEAEARGDKEGMHQYHQQAESIRNKYGDSSNSSGIIGGSTNVTVNVTTDSKGNTKSETKSSSGSTTSVTVTRHAKGTDKIKIPHHAIVDDAGKELILRNTTQGRKTYLEYGDQVFPHDESQAILKTYDKMKNGSNIPDDLIPVEIPDIFKSSTVQSDVFANVYSDMFTGVNTLVKSLDNVSRPQTSNIVYRYNFDKLVLPNVSNGEELISQLKTLSSDALQRTYRR